LKRLLRIVCFVALWVVFYAPVCDLVWSDSESGEDSLRAYKDRIRIQEIEDFRKRRDEFLKSHPRSPLSEEQKQALNGLNYYPIDLNYYFSGKIHLYRFHITNPKYYAEFLTNKGTSKRYLRYGTFSFSIGGKEYELEIYKSILSDNLFVPFKDRTNGVETYGLGRYLDAEVFPGYYMVIDFNRAYNPTCAYNSQFVCVLPPEKNFLDIEIRAGEKAYPAGAIQGGDTAQ
jgi:uncharacterized protein (DUF1684 family)